MTAASPHLGSGIPTTVAIAVAGTASALALAPLVTALAARLPGSLHDELHPSRAGPLATAAASPAAALAASAAYRVAAAAWALLTDAAHRSCVVRVDIDSTDPLYSELMQWLAREHNYGKECTQVMAASGKALFEYDSDSDDEEEAALVARAAGGGDAAAAPAATPKLHYFPTTGTHVFWHAGRPWLLSRSFVDSPAAAELSYRRRMEALSLTTLGTSRACAHLLLEAARKSAVSKGAKRTAVFTGTQHGNWNWLYSRAARPLASVVIDARTKRSLLADARRFMRSEAEYTRVGVPYRRGYLLYGPPGTGKTSLVAALAGELGLPIYALNLAGNELTDSNVTELVADAPRRCILLLEDIHAVFLKPEADKAADSGSDKGKASPASPGSSSSSDDKSEDDGDQGYTFTPPQQGSRVSFSTVLNILDGVMAAEGRLLIVTSNSTDLDPALVRPGRIDKKVYLGNASPAMAAAIADRFFPGDASVAAALAQCVHSAISASSEDLKQSPAAAVAHVSAEEDADEDLALAAALGVPQHHVHAESRVSPATLVGHLMQHRDDAAGAARDVAAVLSALEMKKIAKAG